MSRLVDAFRATGPLGAPLREYLSLTGLGQQWRMFSSPPKVDQYVRVRYYVASGDPGTPGRSLWIATELVMPAHREDRIRLLQSFRDSNRDKAVAIALDNFYRHRKQGLVRPDTTSAALPDDLAPVAGTLARVSRAAIWRFPNALSEPRYGSVKPLFRGGPATIHCVHQPSVWPCFAAITTGRYRAACASLRSRRTTPPRTKPTFGGCWSISRANDGDTAASFR